MNEKFVFIGWLFILTNGSDSFILTRNVILFHFASCTKGVLWKILNINTGYRLFTILFCEICKYDSPNVNNARTNNRSSPSRFQWAKFVFKFWLFESFSFSLSTWSNTGTVSFSAISGIYTIYGIYYPTRTTKKTIDEFSIVKFRTKMLPLQPQIPKPS
jgi:hypothetical protein